MSPFRRVEGARAGPAALGLLVAPGRPTLVIVRPRGLPFDLLPIRTTLHNGLGSGFLQLDRDEASTLVEGLLAGLEAWAAGGAGCVGPIPASGAAGYWIQVEIGAFTLLVCRRLPGQPYTAAVFATLEEARAAAAAVRAVLCPPPGQTQEIYRNIQHFARGSA